MRRAVDNEGGIDWINGTSLTDLDHSDDLALVSRDVASTNIITAISSEEARKVGLEINRDKTKVMMVQCDDATPAELDGEIIKKVGAFTYLCSTICRDGDVRKEMRTRIDR